MPVHMEKHGFTGDQCVGCSISNCREDTPNPPALDVLVWVSEAGGRRSRGKEKGNVSSEGEAGLGLIDYLGETHTPPLH